MSLQLVPLTHDARYTPSARTLWEAGTADARLVAATAVTAAILAFAYWPIVWRVAVIVALIALGASLAAFLGACLLAAARRPGEQLAEPGSNVRVLDGTDE